MPMVLTVLEAHVAPERERVLTAAYRQAAQDSFPPGLLRSTLMQGTSDRTLWRIETLSQSGEAVASMRVAGTPRGIQIFRAAGTEPSVSILEVVEVLSPPGGAA